MRCSLHFAVPAEFPASVLWRFRLASLGTQLVLWLGMGLIFGALTERALRPHTRETLHISSVSAR